MIVVARDHEGVRIAIGELLREPMLQFANERLRRQAEGAGNAERMLQDLKPTRTLADGYYVRANYLLWLRNRMRLVHFRPDQVVASDIDGLLAVEAAVQEFEQAHWQCPHCLMFNERDSFICQKCGFDRQRREQ